MVASLGNEPEPDGDMELIRDPFNLQRFVAAQAEVYARALGELRQGRKRSHWMWYVFPQIAGLGRSSTSRFYAIGTLEEARAYLEHHLLGARLHECTEAVLEVEGKSAEEIFGSPDDMKFRSSMTLFALAEPDPGLFRLALEKYFKGEADALTVQKLTGPPP